MSESNIHVLQDGRKVDPTIDKDPKNWTAERDPPPDVACITFSNPGIDYLSYDPPKGFTAEEILQFQGVAEHNLTLEEINKLIKERDEKGTLNLTGEARYS